jgi:hypothetical protein
MTENPQQQQVSSPEPVKMGSDHPLFSGGFLSKPSQIYNPPGVPGKEGRRRKEQPVSVIMPKQEEDLNAITLSEEALPVMKEVPAEGRRTNGYYLNL